MERMKPSRIGGFHGHNKNLELGLKIVFHSKFVLVDESLGEKFFYGIDFA